MEDILKKLVGYHTTADDPQSMHEAVDYIATFVVSRGMHVERFESNGHESLVATIKPGHKTPKIMLVAHLDVTPAPDEAFELRKSDGRFYGRGTLDMKFAIAAYLQFIDDIHRNLEQYDFGLMITSDEESGGFYGTRELLEEGYLPQVAIIPDGGDNWQLQLTSKGFYYLQLQAYGTPAHGSRPWLGVNAILPLLDAVRDIQALFPESTPESPTFNLGRLSGGAAINQVADYAEASLDIRARTESEKQLLLSKIKGICQKYRIEMTVVLDGSATSFDLHHPLIAAFAAAVTEVTGTVVHGSHTLGSNDARFFATHNVPCISLYPPGAGHHGPEEWMAEEGFYQFKDILDRYMEQIARS